MREAEKAGRIAAEGLVETYISEDGKVGAIVEVNAETDFVAKNEEFKDLVNTILNAIITNDVKTNEDVLKLILEAIGKSGHRAGEDVFLALDIAANEMYEEAKKIKEGGKYYFWKTGELKTIDEMIEYYKDISRRYPIISIEDCLAEDDFEGWEKVSNELGDKIKLVGDDLFVTNKERLLLGIEKNIANSILIKPNQIGTVTETLDTIKLAKEYGYETIVSHRSGETEDSFISDLACGLNIEKVKFGAPCRTDRVCKYNRLLEIENDLLK